MARDDRIQLFENKRIRTAWDAEKEESSPRRRSLSL